MKNDRKSVVEFVTFLRTIGRPLSGNLTFPEDDADSEIDGLIDNLAITHTSFDSYENHRWSDKLFEEFIQPYKDKIGDLVHCSATVVIPVDFHRAVPRKKRQEAAEQFSSWLIKNVPGLPNGKSDYSRSSQIPFDFFVLKNPTSPRIGIWFARQNPQDTELSNRLHRQLIDKHKVDQLSKHKDAGRQTILLLESHDFALINEAIVADAAADVLVPWPRQLDELWFFQRLGDDAANISDLIEGKTWIYDLRKNVIQLHTGNSATIK